MRGTVKTITERGFGFITREGEKKDLFFHSKNLQGVRFDELRTGDELEFDVEQGEKGAFATNIRLVTNN